VLVVIPRERAIIFRDLVGELDVLNVGCDRCGRGGTVSPPSADRTLWHRRQAVRLIRREPVPRPAPRPTDGAENLRKALNYRKSLVMDAGTPVAEFTARQALKAYLRRRLDTFCNPLVYTFADGREPARSRPYRGRWRTEKSWLTITMMAWGAFCRLFPLAPWTLC
jgi:hypothetical protein